MHHPQYAVGVISQCFIIFQKIPAFLACMCRHQRAVMNFHICVSSEEAGLLLGTLLLPQRQASELCLAAGSLRTSTRTDIGS
jgi:hypothetical protein